MAFTGQSSPYMSPMEGFDYSRMSEESSTKEEGGNFMPDVMGVLYSILILGFVGLAAFIIVVAFRNGNQDRADGYAATSGAGDGVPDGRVIQPGGRTSQPRTSETTTRRSRTSRKTRCTPPAGSRTTRRPRPSTLSPADGIHVAVELINSSIDWKYAPCNEFYKFVCSKFHGGNNVLDKLTNHTERAAKVMLETIKIPPVDQTPTEKAAGLYRACVHLGSSPSNSEVHQVKSFLSRLGLDFAAVYVDPAFDILSRVARLNFEFGLQPFVIFGLFRNPPDIPKYTLYMRITKLDQDWMRDKHHFWNDTYRSAVYQRYLQVYDNNIDVVRIAARIFFAESAVLDLMDDLKIEKFPMTLTTVQELGNFTKRTISNDDWVWAIHHFTRRTFTAKDSVLLMDNAPAIVGLLYNSTRLPRHDARLLLAWGLLRRLLPLSHGEWMMKEIASGPRAGVSIEDHCYETVSTIMSMAVTHRYIKTFIPVEVVFSARKVVDDVKDTLKEKLSNTPWIEDPVRAMVLRKITDMWIDMAYPEDYANDAMLEAFYSRFPDVGVDFFTPYINSLRELTIRTFRGYVYGRFKVAEANALYNYEENGVKINAAILQPPVYIFGAPPALNYGGLGQVVGHEMMHAYDIRNIQRDDMSNPINFSDTETMRRYEEKVLCLRNLCLKEEGKSRARTADHWIDSEGFVDYVGLLLAHASFQKLPVDEREAVLPGVGLTAEHLFYIAHCRKWCGPPLPRYFRPAQDPYWPRRSRCVVPLQNMPEFTAAFQCKPGDVMNAEERCPFW